MRKWWRELWCAITTGHKGRIERDPSGNINHRCDNCGKWAMKLVCACGQTDCPHYTPHTPAPPVTFKWIRDYGPYWEPGSTAFWLEPETADELASWYAKYRPGDYGIKEAAGIRISIEPRPRLSEMYGLQQHAGYMNQLAANQQLNMQQYGIQQVGLLGGINQLFGRGL